MQNLINEIRRNLTKLEFAAMEIECSDCEKALTTELDAIKTATAKAARSFGEVKINA